MRIGVPAFAAAQHGADQKGRAAMLEIPIALKVEHEMRALEELGRAAAAERHPEVSRFVEKLKAHAQTEEQVLYPAAILVGEWLKMKFPEVR